MSEADYAFTADVNFGDMFGNLKNGITQGVSSVRDMVVTTWDTMRSALRTTVDGIVGWWKGMVESHPWIPILAIAVALLTAPVWIPLIPAIAHRMLALARYIIKLPFVILGVAR